MDQTDATSGSNLKLNLLFHTIPNNQSVLQIKNFTVLQQLASTYTNLNRAQKTSETNNKKQPSDPLPQDLNTVYYLKQPFSRIPLHKT